MPPEMAAFLTEWSETIFVVASVLAAMLYLHIDRQRLKLDTERAWSAQQREITVIRNRDASVDLEIKQHFVEQSQAFVKQLDEVRQRNESQHEELRQQAIRIAEMRGEIRVGREREDKMIVDFAEARAALKQANENNDKQKAAWAEDKKRMEAQIASLQSQIEVLQRKVEELSMERDEAEKRLAAMAADVKRLSDELANANADNADMQKQINEKDAEIARLQAELVTIQTEKEPTNDSGA